MPGPLAVLLDDRPRRLPAEPAAALVEEHRLGVVAPPPLRRAPAAPGRDGENHSSSAAAAAAPNGTMRSFDPLPNSRTRRPSKSMSPHRQPARLGDPGPGGVQQLEQRPVAPVRPARCRSTASSSAVTSPRSAAWGCPAGTRTPSRSAVGSSARSPSIDEVAVQHADRGQLAGDARRRGAARRPALGDEVDERRRARRSSIVEPCAVSQRCVGGRGRGGRRRSCCAARPRSVASQDRNSSTSSGSSTSSIATIIAVSAGVARAAGARRAAARSTVLASAISPPLDHRHRVGERQVRAASMCSSSGPCSVALDRRAVGGEVDRRTPSRSCPATGRSRSAASSRPAASPASSTSSRRPVSSVGSPVDVAHPGRDLDDRPLVRRPVLRDEDHRRVALGVEDERHDGRPRPASGRCRARSASPSGASKSATTTRQTWPWWTSRSPRRRNAGHASDAASLDAGCDRRRPRRACGAAARRRRAVPGRRRSARGTAGAARSGRLLNSGWACVPTQNGWSAQLDELDQPPVGRRARCSTKPAASSRAR